MKRYADGQSNMASNGSMTDSNYVKKAKIDNAPPSRVLHLRGIPSDTVETDIITLGVPFGRMTNLLLVRQKNQAFIEMADLATAEAMCDYYTERSPQIRGRTVYVQYSKHQVLKTDHSNGAAGLIGSDGSDQSTGYVPYSGYQDSGQNTVLRIIIDNQAYPITLDILNKIFSKYGFVARVVTFSKNNQYHALLQYSDAASASAAKQALNGQNIYNGCCTLRIDVSKLTSLNVKYNNEKSYDYTNPNLPGGGPEPSQYMSAGDGILGSYEGPGSYPGMMPPMGSGGPGMGPAGMPGMGMPSGGLGPAMGSGPNMAGLLGMPGPMGPTGMGMGVMGAMPGGIGGPSGPMGGQMGGMGGVMGGPMGGIGGPLGSMNMQTLSRMSEAQNMVGQETGGCVLLVSNMNQEKITPDVICALFGCYGTVLRVKILYNKKDAAVVQFQEPMTAFNAQNHLDRVTWWGKSIKVTLSKHPEVKMPKDDSTNAGLTKDFSNSPINRFRSQSSKTYTSMICPPSATLHLSGIGPTSEEELRDLFQEHGTVVAFKFLQSKDKRMALIQMNSIEEAVGALAILHNYQLQSHFYLRVSFTKSVIDYQ